MPRLEIRNFDEKTLKKLDEQCKKYGLKSRSEYIRLLVNLDIMTNIVNLINDKE